MARPFIPKWLRKLKPGQYTTNELVKISGTSRANVMAVMKRNKVYKLQNIENGRVVNTYVWTGLEYHI